LRKKQRATNGAVICLKWDIVYGFVKVINESGCILGKTKALTSLILNIN